MAPAVLAAGAGLGAGIGVLCAALAARLSGGAVGGRMLWMAAAEALLGAWGAGAAHDVAAAGCSLLLSSALLVLTAVDLQTLRLPDVITLPLAAAGLVLASFPGGDLASHAIGAAVGWSAIAVVAFAFEALRGRQGIGLGDGKLLAAAGAWLGWAALPWLVLLACALGFAWAGVRWMRDGRASLGRPMPFGPALAAAFWIVWLYGAPAAG